MKQVSGSEEQAAFRKKRVQVLKKLIILSLMLLILIPIVLCSILFVKVNSLEKQISELTVLMEQTQRAETEAIGQAQSEYGSGFIVDTQKEPIVLSEQEEIIKNEPSEEDTRKVYLTFDDGPSSQTDKILDILAEYDVKATFFVNGRTDEKSQAAYRRIVAEGHTLAMHSYSHKYSEIYTSVDDFAADFNKLQEYLYEVTGVWSRYTRFPGGSSNSVSDVDMREFIAWLNEQGITYYDWNISSGDASSGGISAEQIVVNCTENLEKYQTAIILMHDAAGKKTTVEALPEVIETILAMDETVILPITDDTVPIQHVRIKTNE